MSSKKWFMLGLLLIPFLNNCSFKESKSPNHIYGLWVSNDKTAWKFLSGTQKMFVNIEKNQANTVTAMAGLLWQGDYQAEWILSNTKYDSLTRHIILRDTAGNYYTGFFDPAKEMIRGVIYMKGETTDSICFVRAGKDLETALFHPRFPDKNGNITYHYQQPEQLKDLLTTASVSDVGFDSLKIDSLVRDIIHQKYGRLESLLVLKDNKLVLEEYFYGYNKTRLHKINSCTKSITSLVLGMALDRHPKVDINRSIFFFYPQYYSLKTNGKENITLKHVLTMSTGLEWQDYPKEMFEKEDRVGYVLSRPVKYAPGKKFQYNSGNALLIGKLISPITGENARVFTEKNLFQPLGIKNYKWSTYKTGELEFWNGLEMLPRDMAKIGLLVLHEGRWNNTQLISKKWMLESTRSHIAESKYFDYGYQWWIRTKENKPWWKSDTTIAAKPHGMIVAFGAGGQFIIVIKELNLVVITTSNNIDTDKASDNGLIVFPMIVNRIIPALKNYGTET